MNSAIRTFFIFTTLLANSGLVFGMEKREFYKSRHPQKTVTIIKENSDIPFEISVEGNSSKNKGNNALDPYLDFLKIRVGNQSTSFRIINALGLKETDALPSDITLNISVAPLDAGNTNFVALINKDFYIPLEQESSSHTSLNATEKPLDQNLSGKE